MSFDPRDPRYQDPRYRRRNDPPEAESTSDQGGLGGILGQILGGRHAQQQPPEEEDPRYQQRGRRQQHEEPEEHRPAQGGLGGILGQILGGGQGHQEWPQEEDPRYSDPRDDQRSRGQYGRPLPQPEHTHEEDPRQSGVIPQGRGRAGVGGGLLQMLLGNPRILMFLLLAGGSVVMYFMNNKLERNPVTDEEHRVPWEAAKDVPLGLQATPQMIAQHGGLHPDPSLQQEVDRIGMKLVKSNAVGDWEPVFRQYRWDFHLLRDGEMVNAFALPGGQIFFTYGLYKHLKTEDEVAGVLGHEIAHVIARHSAQQMAKSQLISGLVMAGATAASDGQDTGQMAQMIGSMINMKYGRADETEADKLGTQFMNNAGYNSVGIINVMRVLKAQMGNSRQPEILSTHPDPGNREEAIKAVIEDIKAGRIEGPKEVTQPVYR